MVSNKKLINIVGWSVFAIAAIVFFFSAERTGSLWDVGEFILGAYKLQVVHPPGAPLFMIVGRVFAFFGEIFSSKLSDIAFAVNMMSGICTAFVGMFVAWTTMIFGKLAYVGRDGELEGGAQIANAFSGLVAGLSTVFATSVWFSAVEGEVYAMSTFFTALTFWSAVKWYALPDNHKSDRWLLFSLYAVGLSTGVHLLSILTLPAIALLYYFKKYEKHTVFKGMLAIGAGLVGIGIIQKLIVVGIPTLWKNFEIFAVNGLGLPFHSGLVITLALLGALVFIGLKYAHSKGKYLLQMSLVALTLITIGFSTIGVIVIRANADTPVNMNVPSDAVRLLPYLNREQYGERALLYGPHFDAQPVSVKSEKRYGRVGDKYEIVDEKYDYEYRSQDKILFPRIGHGDPGRPQLHRMWWGNDKDVPGMAYNIKFLVQYQLGWMYGRYFMWNFAGRQNGAQGYYPWDKSSGHWVSGIGFVDDAKLDYDTSELPESMQSLANNNYYMLPFIFGLIGLFFHMRKRPKDFMALMMLFLITGIGIIIYSNQPPNEPRERDYVLVGSIFTYCMWIGMAVNALYMGFEKYKFKGIPAAGVAGALVLIAPILMGTQNFDDMGRKDHYASRDYAANFLNSVDENAIIFTYGDNDTYPLWYAQEVEEIRTDVRVVNLSLIAVDWYINKLRSKVNDSPPIKLTISEDAYRGSQRNQLFFYPPDNNSPTNIISALKLMGSDARPQGANPKMKGYIPSKNLIIPTNREAVDRLDMNYPNDPTAIAPYIPFTFPQSKTYLRKDEMAVLDVIGSNIWDRPIYFAVTCKNDKLMGVNDYTQLEGLALRVVPFKTASQTELGIYGSGRVDAEKLYDNVMNKWQWGNFDKKKMFIDNSYGAEIQAMQMAILRGAQEFMSYDRNKAVALADKYFEGFPNFNFPYDDGVYPFIQMYIQSGEMEKAKKHMRILAEVSAERLNFFDTGMAEDVRDNSFRREYVLALRGANNILNDVDKLGDPEFAAEMKALVGNWSLQGLNN
ncbi:glycosyltransferase family 117 protein [Portibacter lacus]|uniref:Membrane protein n=1 Tax=Portibacter lacus TaxID=1099794 RepID=A0AA37STT8_9BACT|nr:DUF2723 domain-containing protein [Portibacter lacus]GLR18711.1 membrane protein [Portibacter lacus]